jgi:hypothetical protein
MPQLGHPVLVAASVSEWILTKLRNLGSSQMPGDQIEPGRSHPRWLGVMVVKFRSVLNTDGSLVLAATKDKAET